MGFFSQKKPAKSGGGGEGDFGYLDRSVGYFDSACQTMRPSGVIAAEQRYYHEYNACGGRVKYAWGERVDREVSAVRAKLLQYLGKSDREYAVAFTANTTYGINLVLHQLDHARYRRIVTSEIEHNSVMLPTISLAQRHGLERVVCGRAEDGALEYEVAQLERAIALVNSCSNIDGRPLANMHALARDVHAEGGILCIDAAQGMVTQRESLSVLDFDCLFASGHKMYAPSLGIIVIKRSLLDQIQPFFVGGGMVASVSRDGYELVTDPAQRIAFLEPGLQDWAGIVGLGAALDWLMTKGTKNITTHFAALQAQLWEGLQDISDIQLINAVASPVVSWYPESSDAHQVALMLSAQGLMARSGYFCCHYYLQTLKGHPPLVRYSLGLHTTADEVARLLQATRQIIQTIR